MSDYLKDTTDGYKNFNVGRDYYWAFHRSITNPPKNSQIPAHEPYPKRSGSG